MIAAKGLRRRVDYQLLRWQARLDGQWADRVLPLAAAFGLFLVLLAMSSAQARSLGNGVELSRWVQGAWHIVNWQDPHPSVVDQHLYEPRGAFGFAVIAQGTRVVGTVPFLLVLQAAALAAAVIPIWRLCRRVCSLRAGAATAAITAYGLYPPLHQLNLADFHPEALAVPLLLTTAYAGFRGRWWWATGLAIAAMSLRSDLGLAVAALSVVLAVDTRARQAPRLFVLGLGWALVSLLVVQPAVGDGSFPYAGAFETYGTSFLGVAWGMLTQPLDVLADLVARENFLTLVALGAPVAFLPGLASRYLLPIVPVVALLFVADVPVTGPEGAANLVPAIVFVFLALPFALARLGRRNIERITVDRRLLGALVVASLVFFVRDSPASPYEEPWTWGGRTLADQARLDAATLVGPDAAVRATEPLVAELAERRRLLLGAEGPGVDARQLADGVDAVVVDETITGNWGSFRSDQLRSDLEQLGFEVAFDRHGVQLYLRSPASASSDAS